MKGAELVLFLLMIGVIAVIIGFALHAQSQRQINHVFSRLAKKYGGRCFPAAAFQRPSVRFTYQGAPVLVDVFSTGGKNPRHYTQLQIAWPDKYLRVSLRPENLFSQFGKFLGMEDIEIGSPPFDARYIINGNDVPAIQELLNAAVQSRIEQLRRFWKFDDVFFSINAGRMLVKKRGYIREYPHLSRFVSMSLELFDQAMLTTLDGIEFVQEQAGVDWSESICQICGEAIRESPVSCANCNTPHHRDCWEYYGACSTYGCGQTRFRVIQK